MYGFFSFILQIFEHLHLMKLLGSLIFPQDCELLEGKNKLF